MSSLRSALLLIVIGCYDPRLPGGGCVPGARIGAGAYATCAIDGAGALFCWGDNSRGFLGLGHTRGVFAPERVELEDPVTQVVAGVEHACALSADGTVWCWGIAGRLGDDTNADRMVPGPIPSLAGVVQLAAGDFHTCARLAGDEVWCWGIGSDGQLGQGSFDNSDVPVPVTLPAEKVIDIGAGGDTSCAILAISGLMCWGRGGSGQIGDGGYTDRSSPVPVEVPGATRVKGGDLFTCALDGAGDLWCFGDNDNGQLGDGTEDERPEPVKALAGGVVTDFALGTDHTCVIADGTVRCWGDDNEGQDGDETLGDAVLVPGTALDLGAGALTLAAGAEHTCAVLEDSRIMCWGDDSLGQLGDGAASQSSDPMEVGRAAGATSIAVGGRTSCVVKDSRAWCWGHNHNGQVGLPDTMQAVPTPSEGSDAGVMDVGVGSAHTCTIQGSSRVVRCWGRNADGQLGDGTTGYSSSPVGVVGVTGAEQLAVGWQHGCALAAMAVSCWGDNAFGQIGNGTFDDAHTAVGVAGTFTDLGAGRGHTCARNGGTVSCWGLNVNGQLGTGTFDDQNTPTGISLSTASDLTLGFDHTCANAGAEDRVYCWGENHFGQLTFADSADVTEPTLTSIGAITSIAAGDDFTCFVREGGEVACAGRNQYGQLGPEGGDDRGATSLPRTIPLPADAVDVAAGIGHACALLEDARVYCWGLDSYGQLGRDVVPSWAPRAVALPSCP